MDFKEKILEKRYEEVFFSSDHNVNWKFTEEFYDDVVSIDRGKRGRIFKLMQKTLNAPERQKMLQTNRKGQFEHKPGKFRFYYIYSKKENLVTFLEFSKKKKQKQNPFASYV